MIFQAKRLPHDPYITAVVDALTAADLPPTDDTWTSDGETRGTYCHLTGVITLDPSRTADLDRDDIPTSAAWPHGLVLIWEWHTGAEESGPDGGPIWEFAERKADGSTEYPTVLPVRGYAGPTAVVDAVRKVIGGEIQPGHFHNGGMPGWTGGIIGDSWEHTEQLRSACDTWGATEVDG